MQLTVLFCQTHCHAVSRALEIMESLFTTPLSQTYTYTYWDVQTALHSPIAAGSVFHYTEPKMSALHDLTVLQRLQQFGQQVVKEVFVAMLQRGLGKRESLYNFASALLRRTNNLHAPVHENKVFFTKALTDVRDCAECLCALFGDTTATAAVEKVMESKSGLMNSLKQSLSINPWKKVTSSFMSSAAAAVQAMPEIKVTEQMVQEMIEQKQFNAESFAVTAKLFSWKDSIRPGLIRSACCKSVSKHASSLGAASELWPG